MEIEQRVLVILKRLGKTYGNVKTSLSYGNPFELLAATILSAQTADIHVNKVTKTIFKKYKSIKDYANVSVDELQNDIKSINYFKTKAKNIKACAEIIMKEHKGQVPKSMEGLTALPGIARKTANIVLSSAFGIIEGIAVDTHVKRLSQRLGLSKNADPVKIEKDLMSVTPRANWPDISNLLIHHGRAVCNAKSPKHDECVLYDICPSNKI